jgi:hypothetical protein
MSARPTSSTPTEFAEEASAWVVGGGVITLALFPLALPALALIAIAAVPFLLLALAAGLVVAGVALPILFVRSLGGRAIRALRPRAAAEPGRPTYGHRASGPQPGAT